MQYILHTIDYHCCSYFILLILDHLILSNSLRPPVPNIHNKGSAATFAKQPTFTPSPLLGPWVIVGLEPRSDPFDTCALPNNGLGSLHRHLHYNPHTASTNTLPSWPF